MEEFKKTKVPAALKDCPIKYMLVFLNTLEVFLDTNTDEQKLCELTEEEWEIICRLRKLKEI